MAEFLKWTKKMSVGVDEIDAQHKHFISMINKTYYLASSGELRSSLNRSVSDLLSYAELHFATEEKYFKAYNYPFSEEHIAQHADLRSRALKFAAMAKNNEDVAVDFMEFLRDWLEEHLKKHDMKYAKYFKNIGAVKGKRIVSPEKKSLKR